MATSDERLENREACWVTWIEGNTVNTCCQYYVIYPHNDGMNLAYVDGHVKWHRKPTGLSQSDYGITANTNWHAAFHAQLISSGLNADGS